MKKQFLFFLAIAIFYFVKPSLGQTPKIDSLKKVIATSKDDTTKVNVLHKLCIELQNFGDYDAALADEFETLELAKKLNWLKGMAKAYNSIGTIYSTQSNYHEAFKSHQAALKIREEMGDKFGIASSYNNLGFVYFAQGNYPDAIKFFINALKIREEIGDKKGISASYNNLGVVYGKQSNYEEALKSHLSSLKIKQEINDQQGLAFSYNNIGEIYKEQGNLDKGLQNYLSALKINEAIGDVEGMGSTYNNIGLVQHKQGNYDEALKNYFAALKIKEEVDAKADIASISVNIGNTYAAQHKTNDGKTWLFKGLAIAKEVGYNECIKTAFQSLASTDSTLGNYKDAYNNYKQYIVYRDSLVNEDNTRKSVQQQMQYEFDKQQTADSLQVAEERKITEMKFQQEKTQRYVLYGGLCLVIVFAAFMFNRFKVTQKQKHIIEIKEQETREQKHLVEEKNKEIMDSITYAKRLQEAILPPQQYIDKYLPNNFVLYKPKDIVAGDFYWMEVINDLIFIAAADSTGHGVPGAMVSVVCSNALNRSVLEFKLLETGKILDKTRELVLDTFAKSNSDVKDGMDISLLCINTQSKKVFWSGAHNSLWYIQNDNLSEVKADKQPIGKTDNPKPYTTHEIVYKENTTFYLFTDGYPDQFGGEKGKKFKYKQLEELLSKNSQLSLLQQKELLNSTFETWRGNLEQVDDVTILALKI